MGTTKTLKSTWGKLHPDDLVDILKDGDNENPELLPENLLAVAVVSIWADQIVNEQLHSELLPVVLPQDVKDLIRVSLLMAAMQDQNKRGVNVINSVKGNRKSKVVPDVDRYQLKLPFEKVEE